MLTNDEIDLLYGANCGDGGPTDVCEKFARAVEAALLEKLAAAEMPEPTEIMDIDMLANEVYSYCDMRKYGAACAARQLSAEPMAWKYTSKLAGNQWFLTSYQSDLSTYKADKVIPLFTRSTT